MFEDEIRDLFKLTGEDFYTYKYRRAIWKKML